MPLKEIPASKDGKVRVFAGSQARIIIGADGKVLMNKRAGTCPTMTICPASHALKVGTNSEIAAEKAAKGKL